MEMSVALVSGARQSLWSSAAQAQQQPGFDAGVRAALLGAPEER